MASGRDNKESLPNAPTASSYTSNPNKSSQRAMRDVDVSVKQGEFRFIGTGPEGNGIQRVDLPPIVRHREVLVPAPELIESVVDVPHVQYLERIEEVVKPRKVYKTVAQPKVDVTERIIEIPKHVKDQKIVEVPQVQVVDQVVEIPQYITQQKIVERPKILLQERIIPIPKRVIEEKVVEVPKDEFDQILKERVEYTTPAYGLAQPMARRPDLEPLLAEDQPLFDINGNPLLDEAGNQIYREARGGEPLDDVQLNDGYAPYLDVKRGLLGPSGRPVDEVVEIPHIQHVYRNIMQPVYRHVPKPVEVPLTHYKPIPVERVVDRNVPIPVELEVVQEFMCPKLEAKYNEVPVPIPVTRIIEKPVAADAMFNSIILNAYMEGHPPEVAPLCQPCTTTPPPMSKPKMTAAELHAAGIDIDAPFSQLKSFNSRDSVGGFKGFRIEHSRDFFTQQRSLFKEA